MVVLRDAQQFLRLGEELVHDHPAELAPERAEPEALRHEVERRQRDHGIEGRAGRLVVRRGHDHVRRAAEQRILAPLHHRPVQQRVLHRRRQRAVVHRPQDPLDELRADDVHRVEVVHDGEVHRPAVAARGRGLERVEQRVDLPGRHVLAVVVAAGAAELDERRHLRVRWKLAFRQAVLRAHAADFDGADGADGDAVLAAQALALAGFGHGGRAGDHRDGLRRTVLDAGSATHAFFAIDFEIHHCSVSREVDSCSGDASPSSGPGNQVRPYFRMQ